MRRDRDALEDIEEEYGGGPDDDEDYAEANDPDVRLGRGEPEKEDGQTEFDEGHICYVGEGGENNVLFVVRSKGWCFGDWSGAERTAWRRTLVASMRFAGDNVELCLPMP